MLYSPGVDALTDCIATNFACLFAQMSCVAVVASAKIGLWPTKADSWDEPVLGT